MVAEVANMPAEARQPKRCPRAAGTVQPGDTLEVVGGAANGGILVRLGKSTTSAEATERLAAGSLVQAVACEGERLSYELLTGAGPQVGWVSLQVGGKALLVAKDDESKDNDQAIVWYGKRLESSRVEDSSFLFARNAFPWKSVFHCGGENTQQQQALRAELESCVADGVEEPQPAKKGGRGADEVEDSDGERTFLCRQCRLPLGSNVYAKEEKGGKKLLMHGECMAQVLSQEMRLGEVTRKRKEATLKRSRREEFDIGWKVSAIPDNKVAAERFGCAVVPQGLSCLVFQEDGSVRVAPTFEPAAALNLEYLSLALKVRRLEGREPLFSLDPVDAAKSVRDNDPEASMQLKRFEPEWLAGTSVGEVMFQADYHLKELSMGEYEQPIVGMKSCFEYSETEGLETEWSAREWFVVRQAEIQVSDDNVIVPCLKMGVEAREQFLGPNGLEDAPLTRPNHPLVKYAAAFTQHFDLISERKSVVSQLREVAKASIMAKFMMESGIHIDEAWFGVGEALNPTCCLEVPQLWNDRACSKIRVQDGTILKAEKGDDKVHSVYGGVDFGIDRFRLAAPSRIATSVVAGRAALGRPASSLMATTQAGLSMAPTRQFSRLGAPLASRASMAGQLAAPISARVGLSSPLSAMSMARPASSLMATSRLSMAAPMGGRATGLAAPLMQLSAARPASSLMAATSRISMSAPSSLMPRGVDLSLEKFNLSGASEPGSWAGRLEAPAETKDLIMGGDAFWASLSGLRGVFSDDDKELFVNVFNARLSDRQSEGPAFVPPPTSSAYLGKLRTLVKAEEAIRAQRRGHFFSAKFSTEHVGPLFPMSWTSAVEFHDPQGAERRALQPRPDLLSEEAWLQDALRSAAPVFEKATEDGVVFLIYRLGNLEVRATADHDGAKRIGAVFSVHAAASAVRATAGDARGASIPEAEKVVKVTEYVEKAQHGTLQCQYYVVLQTAGGHMVVTEMLASGKTTWSENPQGAEDRHSLAKVLRSADCASRGLTVGSMHAFQTKEGGGAPRPAPAAPATVARCKGYSRQVFCRLSGQAAAAALVSGRSADRVPELVMQLRAQRPGF